MAWPYSQAPAESRACVPRDFNPHVSEGGLDPCPWWYIPERGIYHHPKLTQPRPCRARDPQAKRGDSTSPPGWPAHVTCGNDKGGQPEWNRRPGPDCGSRLTALDHRDCSSLNWLVSGLVRAGWVVFGLVRAAGRRS